MEIWIWNLETGSCDSWHLRIWSHASRPAVPGSQSSCHKNLAGVRERAISFSRRLTSLGVSHICWMYAEECAEKEAYGNEGPCIAALCIHPNLLGVSGGSPRCRLLKLGVHIVATREKKQTPLLSAVLLVWTSSKHWPRSCKSLPKGFVVRRPCILPQHNTFPLDLITGPLAVFSKCAGYS